MMNCEAFLKIKEPDKPINIYKTLKKINSLNSAINSAYVPMLME